MGKIINAYKILSGKPEEKRSPGRPRHGCKNNSEMDIKETGCKCVEWIQLACDRNQWWTTMNLTTNLQIS
jgi:hypothetical protein